MFEHLKHIIETKDNLDQDLNLDPTFVPFLAQRWVSMYNEKFCLDINETTNYVFRGLYDKNDWYKILQVCTPCNKNKFIKYIKKVKEKEDKDKDYIKFLSSTLEISNKEARETLQNTPSLKKQLKVSLGK